MTFPSVNAIGGTIAVIALGTVLYFGATQAACPPLAPAAVVAPTAVAPPAPVVKSEPAPVAAPKKRPLAFRTVKKMDCSWVPAVTKQYTKAQVISAADQYGLFPAQVAALRSCLN